MYMYIYYIYKLLFLDIKILQKKKIKFTRIKNNEINKYYSEGNIS